MSEDQNQGKSPVGDNDDDAFAFAEEEDAPHSNSKLKRRRVFTVLIVDDEEEVHEVTKIVLRNFCFDNCELRFASAYSAAEAKSYLEQQTPEVAFIDVIMEENESGLQLVDYIRKEMNNLLMRIILRTGQPGTFNELDVMEKYDINHYRTKTELTRDKMCVTVLAAIRSYRQLEETLTLREELIRTTKLAGIGELAAGIVHDIANPLTVIKCAAEILIREAEANPKATKQVAEKIRSSSQVLEGIVRRLMNYVRKDIEPKNVSLPSLVEEAIGIVSPKIKKQGITIQREIDQVSVFCVGNYLLQVMINLLSNACDALQEQVNPVIRITYGQDGEHHQISIADNGPGIAPEIQEKVFHSLFSTKGTSGTGLGLSISASLVEQCGGTLNLESDGQNGCAFHIHLPLNKQL